MVTLHVPNFHTFRNGFTDRRMGQHPLKLGATGRTRTVTPIAADFKSAVSTDSTTIALKLEQATGFEPAYNWFAISFLAFRTCLHKTWCGQQESNPHRTVQKTVALSIRPQPHNSFWCRHLVTLQTLWIFSPSLSLDQLQRHNNSGVPTGTRTPTDSFGDCNAAITLSRHNWGVLWGTIPYYDFHRVGCEPLH